MRRKINKPQKDPQDRRRRAPQFVSPLLNVAEVADYLSMSEKSVRRLIAAGTLPEIRMGSVIRLRKSDLDAYIDRCAVY